MHQALRNLAGKLIGLMILIEALLGMVVAFGHAIFFDSTPIWFYGVALAGAALLTALLSLGLTNTLIKQAARRELAERRQAENALRAERDLLNAILDTSVQAITVLNPDGQIIFANQQVAHVLGISQDMATGRGYNAPEWRHTDLDGGPWPDERQPFRVVMRTGSPVYDVQHAIEWPDGRRKILSINGVPLKDAEGRITSAVFAVTDITEHKRAEELMHKNEEQLRSLIHDINIGITLHSPDARLLLCNPAACAILGVSEQELMDYQFGSRAWDPIKENGQPYLRDELALFVAIRTRQTVHHHVVGMRTRPDAERVWLLMSAVPQFEADGSLRYIITSISDITDRRRLEEQLRRSQKMEAMGRLAGGIAHDFNNLLTVIHGNSELLLSSDTLSPELRQDLDQIRAASQRAAELTRQLLAFGRQQLFKPRVMSINRILADVERLLRRLIGEDVVLDVQLQPDLWMVRAAPSQIEQVVMNLAVNARDAMPQGGRLTISTRNVLVHMPPAKAGVDLPPGAYVQLTVSDTGSGIDEQHWPYIFEPFYTTKPIGKGTGLGLAMVHGIVSQSGGEIRFQSQVGHGTCFNIYLPRVEETESFDIDDLSDEHELSRGGRVLLVEDEAQVRELLVRVLQQHGYTVFEAADGEQARQLVASDGLAIDLLLTDVVMPGGLSGIQLAAELTAMRPGLRTIYMSGYAESRDGMEATIGEGAQFLAKPFRPETLVRKVREALRHRS